MSRWPWPSACRFCGDWTGWRRRPWCDACHVRFVAPVAGVTRCFQCALPNPLAGTVCAPARSWRCIACSAEQPPWSSAWVAVDYGFPWASCIADFKYHDQPGLASTLGALLATVLPPSSPWDLLLPVPMSESRWRERGYNQAALLTQELSRRLRCSWNDATLLALTGQHDHVHQASLRREDRLAHLEGTMWVPPRPARALEGLRVLVVDDVMTTGATLREATRALLKAGARQVDVAAFARTP